MVGVAKPQGHLHPELHFADQRRPLGVGNDHFVVAAEGEHLARADVCAERGAGVRVELEQRVVGPQQRAVLEPRHGGVLLHGRAERRSRGHFGEPRDLLLVLLVLASIR